MSVSRKDCPCGSKALSDMYPHAHADQWAYLLNWIQFNGASVKVN